MKIAIKSSPLKQLALLTLLGLALFFPTQVMAQKTFEGVVTYKVDSQGNGPSSFTYYLKGNRARMEMEMPGQAQMGKTAFIINGDKKEIVTLIPKMKIYMQMQMPAMDSTDYSTDTGKDEKPVKVGDTEVIAGQTCEHWRIHNEDGETVDMWNAKGFGNFMFPGGMNGMSGSRNQPQWMKDLMAKGFFPLKVVVTNPAGNTEMSMEATKIEKKSLGSGLFEIPQGYNKMNIPNMGNMMQH